MAESFFGYGVTRRYPYPWFTWVVVVGGLASIAILSVVNLAANGYEPSIVISSNPNKTVFPEEPQWYQKKPWSRAAKVSSTCQDQRLTVGSELYTNNFGFPYKITSLTRNGTGPMASYIYHNDFLHDCQIPSIQLTQDKDNPEGFIDASAMISCTLYEDFLPISITLGFSAVIVPKNGIIANPVSSLASTPAYELLHQASQISLYWGQTMIAFNSRLLQMHEIKLDYYEYVSELESKSPGSSFLADSSPVAVQAVFNYGGEASNWFLGRSGAGRTSSYPPDHVWFSTFATDLLSLEWVSSDGIHASDDASPVRNSSDLRTINALLLDGVAKSLYFTILSDLGQTTEANAFASPERTFEFCNKTYQMAKAAFGYGVNRSFSELPFSPGNPPSSMDDFYTWAGIEAPSVQPTTISMQYLCQVPKLKSAGSLIVSIIVADLVFLQALWFILNSLTTFFVQRRNPEATYCPGCVGTTVETCDGAADAEVADDGSGTDSITHNVPRSSSIDRQKYTPLPRIVSRSPLAISPSIRSRASTDYGQGQDHMEPSPTNRPTYER